MRDLLLLALLLLPLQAKAEFSVSSAILEFTQDGPHQQDIELVSRGTNQDYIVSEVNEIVNPGAANESRHLIKDPANSMLLVTPDKTVLAAGNRRVLRFVLLKDLDDKEHVYRVAVKPVINGLQSDSKLGLKILVGYEVLVILRPAVMMPAYNATRHGNKIEVTNTGNTGVLFQNGQQCEGQSGVIKANTAPDNTCRLPPAIRVYAGQKAEIPLPANAPVSYSVWDGKTTEVKTLN